MILTAGALAFSLSSFFTGAVSEKVGRKLSISVSLILLVFSGVGLIYADRLLTLVGFYVLFCLAEAVPYLMSLVYASEAFDKS